MTTSEDFIYVYTPNYMADTPTSEAEMREHYLEMLEREWEGRLPDRFPDMHLIVEDAKLFASDAEGEDLVQIGLVHKVSFGISGVTLTFIDDAGPTRTFSWEKVTDLRSTR